ncbi:MAG: phosphonate C-P lyase system protein PhnH [Donghicola eburneus]|nr:phosphonate C-P lyase system protein PhnH [Donghicola eburneus]MCI5040966.1 phosphonate C-P lyase system protein PhnH [Donghicola eburneus]
MPQDTLTGGFTEAPQQSARAFRSLMNALARPGTIEEITGGTGPAPMSAAAATTLLTLCDGETPIHLAGDHDTDAIRQWIAFHIGAPICARDQAMFAVGRWQDLTPISEFPIGTPEYPDRSTTLIVEMDALSNTGATLTGPGIQTTAQLSLPETAAFQQNRMLFPMGVDCYFTAGTRIAALPRSTKVEAY